MIMRLLYVSLAVLLSVCPASAQTLMTAFWDAEPAASGYRVYVGTAPGVYAPPVDVQAARTYEFTRPTAQRIYVAVASYNATGEGPKSAEVADPPLEPVPPPQPSADMSLTASPTTIIQGASSTLSYAWNALTRHVVKLDGSSLPCQPVNNLCAGTVTVTPATTTVYTLSAVLADGTPVPSLTTTVTVNPLTPPPPPPPTAQPGPVVTIRSCSEYVEVEKPASATGTGWVVQYFDDGIAITTASSTRKRAVTLQPGMHAISAVWTKTGVQPIQMGTTMTECA